jgi:hypothetical protein
MLGERGVGDDQRRAGVAQDVRELVGLEMPVHEHDRGVQLAGRRPRLEELEPVREHDGDAVSRTDPPPAQRVGEPCRALVELGEGAHLVADDERGLVGCHARVTRDAGKVHWGHTVECE